MTEVTAAGIGAGGAGDAPHAAEAPHAGAPHPTSITVAGVAVDTRHWIGGERVASAAGFTDVSPIDGHVI
ncbi:hypothetical protein, partial [Streptomyces sp. SID3343]|uniref:hypothetical protein n=1 Tax=Streptomyces sp. SID3343 TaxID=2690260 RepID=UPI0013C01215